MLNLFLIGTDSDTSEMKDLVRTNHHLVPYSSFLHPFTNPLLVLAILIVGGCSRKISPDFVEKCKVSKVVFLSHSPVNSFYASPKFMPPKQSGDTFHGYCER
jgi:hypothetical protein